jgi:hypothetical protein
MIERGSPEMMRWSSFGPCIETDTVLWRCFRGYRWVTVTGYMDRARNVLSKRRTTKRKGQDRK